MLPLLVFSVIVVAILIYVQYQINSSDIPPARDTRMRDNQRVWDTGMVLRRPATLRKYTRLRSRTPRRTSQPTSSQSLRVRSEAALTCSKARIGPSKRWGCCASRVPDDSSGAAHVVYSIGI